MRPKTLVFFGTVFILLPLFNYMSFAIEKGIHYGMPTLLLSALPIPALVLAAVTPIIGVGLLMVKKWAWRAFLLYACLLLAHNAVALALSITDYNLGVLLQSSVGLAGMIYFTRADISAPFMKSYPRGWRLQKRNPREISVRVDDVATTTRDCSARGVFVNWPECPYEVGRAVTIAFEWHGRDVRLDAVVVRLDENGAGIAFRSVAGAEKRFLRGL